jgi:hypothetical protein
MSWQVTAGEFANRPRAESTESTESFQPHLLGERANVEHQCYDNSPVPEPKRQKLSAHSAHSVVPLDAQKRYMLREPDRALPEAQPSGCARQAERKVVTSRLTKHPPMRIDLEADEPVQASTVSNCPAIIVLL